jgi:hypothetical protein
MIDDLRVYINADDLQSVRCKGTRRGQTDIAKTQYTKFLYSQE